jgi:hypothetical protein
MLPISRSRGEGVHIERVRQDNGIFHRKRVMRLLRATMNLEQVDGRGGGFTAKLACTWRLTKMSAIPRLVGWLDRDCTLAWTIQSQSAKKYSAIQAKGSSILALLATSALVPAGLLSRRMTACRRECRNRQRRSVRENRRRPDRPTMALSVFHRRRVPISVSYEEHRGLIRLRKV